MEKTVRLLYLTLHICQDKVAAVVLDVHVMMVVQVAVAAVAFSAVPADFTILQVEHVLLVVMTMMGLVETQVLVITTDI
jgi:hypothetical protein